MSRGRHTAKQQRAIGCQCRRSSGRGTFGPGSAEPTSQPSRHRRLRISAATADCSARSTIYPVRQANGAKEPDDGRRSSQHQYRGAETDRVFLIGPRLDVEAVADGTCTYGSRVDQSVWTSPSHRGDSVDAHVRDINDTDATGGVDLDDGDAHV